MTHSRRDFFRSMAQIAAVTACAPALRVVEKMVFVAPTAEVTAAYASCSTLTLQMILDAWLHVQRVAGQEHGPILLTERQYESWTAYYKKGLS